MKLVLRLLPTLPVLAATLWGTLALWYAGPGPTWLKAALAAVFAVGTLGALVWLRPFRRALLVWAAAFALLLVWWIQIQPSNNRDWAPEVARLPSIEVHGDRLTFHNVRNFDYRTETDFTPRYEDRTVDLSRLRGLDLFVVYWGSPWIAHTIMSWQFEDSPPLAVSIETRKRRGQQYSAVEGFFKQYELIYVVADERDLIRLRTNYRGEEVYLYRLAVPIPQARALLLDYVAAINGLVDRPKFYNALRDNCTTTIRQHVKHIDPGAPPLDWRMIANGYGDRMLYERGRLDTRLPFEELKRRSFVNEKAKAAGQDPMFSARIREGLAEPRAPGS